MQLEDIKKLAELARIEMSDEEMKAMADDFEPILAYVGQVQEISDSDNAGEEYILTNVMREDIVTNDQGSYTDKLLEQMPESLDGFLKVKQIL